MQGIMERELIVSELPRRTRQTTVVVAVLALVSVFAAGFGLARAPEAQAVPNPNWVATWIVAPGETGSVAANTTIRNIVRTSVGGSEVRVKLSNRYSPSSLTVGHTTVALPATGASTERTALAGSMREVTFNGNAAVTIPAGEDVWSDPVSLNVPGASNLLLSFHIAAASPNLTRHGLGLQTSYYYNGGDRASNLAGADFPLSYNQVYVTTQVDVRGSEAAGTVVAFGDSITDGISSPANSNQRWPNRLSARLNGSGDVLSVVNAGISGNRLLTNGAGRAGTTRFAWDVLAVSGVKAVVIFIGINDIQHTDVPVATTAPGMIAGYTQIANQARAAGLAVFGATILPTKGYNQYTAANEVIRTTVNDWLRASPYSDGIFDAVFDFDAALRNPSDPQSLLPLYDSGDFLHPNATAFEIMAELANVISRPQLTLAASPATPDGDNGWWTSSVLVTPTATAAPQPGHAPAMTYTVNGTLRATAGSQLLLDEDGEYEVSARAAYLGVSSDPEELAVKIDATAPTSSATFDEQASTFAIEGTDPAGGSGLAGVEYSVDSPDGPFVPFTAPVALERTADHVVYHRAHDLAGNVGSVGELAVAALPVPPAKSKTKAKLGGGKLKITVTVAGRPVAQVKGKAVVVIKRGGKTVLSKTVNVKSGKASLALGKIKPARKGKKKQTYKVSVAFNPATNANLLTSTGKTTFKR